MTQHHKPGYSWTTSLFRAVLEARKSKVESPADLVRTFWFIDSRLLAVSLHGRRAKRASLSWHIVGFEEPCVELNTTRLFHRKLEPDILKKQNTYAKFKTLPSLPASYPHRYMFRQEPRDSLSTTSKSSIVLSPQFSGKELHFQHAESILNSK